MGIGVDEWTSHAARQKPHRVLVFHPVGANNLLDLWRSSTKNNIKEQPGCSDKSLLKLALVNGVHNVADKAIATVLDAAILSFILVHFGVGIKVRADGQVGDPQGG